MLSKKFTAVAGAAAAATDDYFKNTTLLLSGDGTNGAQNNTFLDSSTNNFTITRNGNTTQGSFSPYTSAGSSWSNYFDGSSYLNLTTNAGLGLGTGTYTVECWVYASSAPAYSSFLQIDTSGLQFGLDPSGYISIAQQNVAFVVSSSTTLPLNTWNHVAVSRDGSNITRIFLNGTQIASATDTTNFATGTTAYINRNSGNSAKITGYISNLRVLKGTALYTSAFTPPTEPLTAITNTSLLTCQSNRFIDNSSNAFAITANSSPSVQRFNPFNPTSAYSTSTVGGSGYFDDSGDYLTTSSSAISYTGDFCIECWFYTNTTKTYACIYSDENTGVGGTILLNNGSNNGQITVYCGSISNFASTSTGLNNNAWHHVAFTRSGSTVRLFIDGKLENTTTASGTITTPSTFRIGTSFFSNRDFLGYISGFRCVSGSAVYTSAFTPPTSPPTAITNTSLLLNFTNAGIYDSAMMNDLETVGNAQISTSTKKYGTASIAFDGTGDYLLSNVATSDLYAFGTGNYTIEMWIYFNNVSTLGVFYDSRPTSTNGIYPTLYVSGGNVYFYINSANEGSAAVSTGQWYHLAVCRSSGTVKMFLNGTQSATWADTRNYLNGSNRPIIGSSGFGAGDAFNGYIDDLRITKGYARYTSNFTAPTEALPNY